MRNNFFAFICLLVSLNATAQIDTNFRIRIINFEWMPDARHLVLGVMKFDKNRKLPPTSGVFLFNMDNKRISPLIPGGYNPAISPDGNLIAFVKQMNDKQNIFLYDMRTTQEKPMSDDTFSKSSPQWSPDGKTIVYTKVTGTGRNAILDIYAIDIASKEIKQIVPGEKYRNFNPVWSPDGKWIVYYLEKGDNRDQIYITDNKGNSQRNITNDTSTHNFYPSWYAQNKILYTWSPNRLAIINIDGTNREVIEGVTTFFARYNAKANEIAFIQMPDGSLNLYDVKNKKTEMLIDEKSLLGLF